MSAYTINEFYGTVVDAQDYFANRLHEHAWSAATADDRLKALKDATQRIDRLNYKGEKAAVYTVLVANELESVKEATDAQLELIRAAEASQVLEFPRGADTEAPGDIVRACFEITHALLDGVDPDIEMENLSVISDGISSVRTTYNRSQNPQDHLINGIPSITAWRMLQPFLRDDQTLRLNKV